MRWLCVQNGINEEWPHTVGSYSFYCKLAEKSGLLGFAFLDRSSYTVITVGNIY